MTRGGEYNRRRTIEHVDKLLLFDGANHASAALRVRSQVLAGDDAPDPALAIGFLVNLGTGRHNIATRIK